MFSTVDGKTVLLTCSKSTFCQVCYGTSPDSLMNCSSSDEMGSAGENVTVELELPAYGVLYYIQATLWTKQTMCTSQIRNISTDYAPTSQPATPHTPGSELVTFSLNTCVYV